MLTQEAETDQYEHLSARTKISLKARVKRGAAFLDRIHPGWREHVDTSRLNLVSPHSCVLGQVYRVVKPGQPTGWSNVKDHFKPLLPAYNFGDRWAEMFGFDATMDEVTYLEDLWVKNITDHPSV